MFVPKTYHSVEESRSLRVDLFTNFDRQVQGRMDRLDYQIVELLDRKPGTSVVQIARELGVARPTVQSRLSRMRKDGVLIDILPRLDTTALGFPVTALTTLQIDQRVGIEHLDRELLQVPEVIDAVTVAGDWDVLVRVVARSNADLQRVIDRIASIEAVTRTSTSVQMQRIAHDRILPLFEAATAETPDSKPHLQAVDG